MDPGSQVAGVACFLGRELVSASSLRVRGSPDPLPRIYALAGAVVDWIDQTAQTHLRGSESFRSYVKAPVLLELPGSQGGHGHSNGAALITMGAALGAIYSALRAGRDRWDIDLVLVPIQAWGRLGAYGRAVTGGRSNIIPKADRLKVVRSVCPRYRPADDPGGDAGDAVGMGLWWLGEFGIQA